MKVILESSYQRMSNAAAAIIAETVIKKPDTVFALPTGSTPLGTYKQLVYIHETYGLDLSRIRCFNLDEYVHLGTKDESSYFHFLLTNFYLPAGIAFGQAPAGEAEDLERASRNYQDDIDAVGGIDFAFLGIGRNGHLAFNEPGPSLSLNVHVQELSEETIRDNARFFSGPEEVPRRAITMGMGTIMHAKRILLIAGEDKKETMDILLGETTVRPEFPASFLHLHPDVTVITVR